ncbi:MAG TPA: hypothetical protein PLF78_08445 [Caulobacter sp.]|nr:hypothetical protein [Caulobacter sp.]
MARGLKTLAERDQRTRFILLILATAACVGLAPVGAVGTLFSPLVFDDRGNLLNPLAWLGFFLMITFWIVCLIAPFVAWVYWRRKREPMAWSVMSAPLIWGLLTVIVLQFIPG